jgi:DNA-binding response OmpR family regulator
VHALIIEDESLIAFAIEEALSECGFTSFDVAVSANEAIEAAARRCPDLITADVELRPGCGIGAVQSICSELPIPVLFITGRPVEVRTRMPQHPLIEKPFTADHILAAVKLTLERRNLSATSRERQIDGGR